VLGEGEFKVDDDGAPLPCLAFPFLGPYRRATLFSERDVGGLTPRQLLHVVENGKKKFWVWVWSKGGDERKHELSVQRVGMEDTYQPGFSGGAPRQDVA
jgi:hypothetical protein